MVGGQSVTSIKSRLNRAFNRVRIASDNENPRKRPKSKKNACDWPMKSPTSVRNLTRPMATPLVLVGRTIGQMRLGSKNGHGSGMIKGPETSLIGLSPDQRQSRAARCPPYLTKFEMHGLGTADARLVK